MLGDEERGLSNPLVQESLVAEAIGSAEVGFVVWDDDRRYIVANARACAILGCTLDEIIGARVGARTEGGDDAVAAAMRESPLQGRATIDRFDGAGKVEIEYVTFQTRAAGLPYMASVIWPARD
jgi:PAS domain-containing protein